MNLVARSAQLALTGSWVIPTAEKLPTTVSFECAVSTLSAGTTIEKRHGERVGEPTNEPIEVWPMSLAAGLTLDQESLGSSPGAPATKTTIVDAGPSQGARVPVP